MTACRLSRYGAPGALRARGGGLRPVRAPAALAPAHRPFPNPAAMSAADAGACRCTPCAGADWTSAAATAVHRMQYIKKASALLGACQDEELELQYKSCYARIVDAKRRCALAASLAVGSRHAARACPPSCGARTRLGAHATEAGRWQAAGLCRAGGPWVWDVPGPHMPGVLDTLQVPGCRAALLRAQQHRRQGDRRQDDRRGGLGAGKCWGAALCIPWGCWTRPHAAALQHPPLCPPPGCCAPRRTPAQNARARRAHVAAGAARGHHLCHPGARRPPALAHAGGPVQGRAQQPAARVPLPGEGVPGAHPEKVGCWRHGCPAGRRQRGVQWFLCGVLAAAGQALAGQTSTPPEPWRPTLEANMRPCACRAAWCASRRAGVQSDGICQGERRCGLRAAGTRCWRLQRH